MSDHYPRRLIFGVLCKFPMI